MRAGVGVVGGKKLLEKTSHLFSCNSIRARARVYVRDCQSAERASLFGAEIPTWFFSVFAVCRCFRARVIASFLAGCVVYG